MSVEVVEYADLQLRELLMWPAFDAHKYTRGKLVLVAGAAAYPGAACLAGAAAQRAGAGYVEVVCAPESVNVVRAWRPSLVARTWDGWHADDVPAPGAGRPAACAIGPGFDVRCPRCAELTLEAVCGVRAPLLADGGALGVLATEEGVRAARSRAARGDVLVLTPHGGEAARLARAAGVPDAASDAPELAAALAEAYGATVVLKGSDTFVASPEWAGGAAGGASAGAGGARAACNTQVASADGTQAASATSAVTGAQAPPASAPVVAMRRGTPALSKAGTGDVLAGIIGALLAQGLSACDAAVLGATLHAEAGRAAQDALTSICVVPEDVVEALPQAVRALSARRE